MAADGFLRIAITLPEPPEDESRRVTRLLDSGRFDIVHLRHPGASGREMRAIIEEIPGRLHRRLRLHGHFDLAAEFNLGGLHLNGRCPEPPAFYSGPLSRSCHSVGEVLGARGFDYVTLSPVFDSVSKAGYRAAFTTADLSRLADAGDIPRVIALGGVTPEKAADLDRRIFGGYAMLGAVGWESL